MLLIILLGVSIQLTGSYTNWIDSPSILIDNSVLSEVTLSSFIGGSLADTVDCVVADDLNNIYIAGRTRSNNIPSDGNLGFEYSGMNDYYVMKLSSTREIVYATYIGADGYDGSPVIDPLSACSIDVDNLGRVYMTGTTDSYNFPVVNAWEEEHQGFGDCFALRLSPTGNSIEYSTFLGGYDDLDVGTAIKVDDSYNAFICGWTRSSTFPTLQAHDYNLGGNSDVFLLKLSSSGQLVFSTYVGGSDRESTLGGSSLALDNENNAYIIGSTSSPDLPITNYAIPYNDPSDLFFWKVDSQGNFLTGSYYGGTLTDEVGGIAVDDQGHIYLTGLAGGDISLDYSIGPNPQAFVAKFENWGSLIHSTGFGGTEINRPLGLVIDEEDCPWVTGYSYASDFPLEDPIEDSYDGLGDCFILKLSSYGDRLLFSSYLGGSQEEMGFAVAATHFGRVFVGGVTNSSDFLCVNPLIATNLDLDGFIVEFEDIWEDTPPPTTSTTTTNTIPTTTTTTTTSPSQTSGSTTPPFPDNPNTLVSLDTLLTIGLCLELVVLSIMVLFIKKQQ